MAVPFCAVTVTVSVLDPTLSSSSASSGVSVVVVVRDDHHGIVVGLRRRQLHRVDLVDHRCRVGVAY